MTDHPAPLHAHGSDSLRLGGALAITATFMVLEVVGGLLSGSLALLACRAAAPETDEIA